MSAFPVIVLAEDKVPVDVIETSLSSHYQLRCGQYRELLERYDWDSELMIKIMQGESGCNPNAVGDKHLTFNDNSQGMSCGLMQIRVLDGRPDCETLKDPETNIEWAYKIYQSQGLSAWTYYTKHLALK